jgi:hypothetical protein
MHLLLIRGDDAHILEREPRQTAGTNGLLELQHVADDNLHLAYVEPPRGIPFAFVFAFDAMEDEGKLGGGKTTLA